MKTTPTNAKTAPISDSDVTDRRQLMAQFKAEFGREPPARASLALIGQNLAWSKQAKTAGLAPRAHRAQLIRKLARQLNGKSSTTAYRPGTRLVREWRGQLYEVTVQEDGYRWNDRLYSNLTQIATEITGTKWSGPRFFWANGEEA
jgi:hypothetical protein